MVGDRETLYDVQLKAYCCEDSEKVIMVLLDVG
jgi:hypothetical protein